MYSRIVSANEDPERKDLTMTTNSTYGATSGDGTIEARGMTLAQARRRAQDIADRTGDDAEVWRESDRTTVETVSPDRS